MQAPSHTERIVKLLDLCKEKTGSDYATAKQIGASSQAIWSWRHGKNCPIEKQAVMAELAGLSAIEVVAYAMVESAKTPEEKERMYTAVGKRLPATSEEACLSISDNDGLAFSWPKSIRSMLDTMYRIVKWYDALRLAL